MELSQEAAYTKGELEAYDQYWDAMSTDKTRTVDAWNEGKAEGIAEGKAEGIVDAAYKAIRAGLMTIEIAKGVFGLTPEQEALLNKRLS
jgi:hypothetical protein